MMVGVFYAVIPAGGSGTRLWPLSRAGHPKFLHALTGTSATLLQATVDRLSALSNPEATFVVTGVAHAAAVARQLPTLPDANILVEPSPRDSCAAIGLAAAIVTNNLVPLSQVAFVLRLHPFGRPMLVAAALAVACFGAVPLAVVAVAGTTPASAAVAGALGGAGYLFAIARTRRALRLGG